MVNHIYLDGTFVVVPMGYKQLIVVSIRDPNIDKVYPAVFGIINCKEEDAYFIFLKQLKDIITEFGAFDWGLEYATLDFEEGLQEAFKRIFPKARIIGCLFHYRQALYRQAQSRRLTTEAKKKETQELIDQLSALSWLDSNTQFKEKLNLIKTKYKNFSQYEDFLAYFEKHWYPRFESGQILYSNKEDVYRSNSVLESYNNHIKNILPRSPTWPQFLEFIKAEDKKYSEDAIFSELKAKVNNKSRNFGKAFKPLGTKKRKKPCEETTPKKNETQNDPILSTKEKNPYELKRDRSELKKCKLTLTDSTLSIPWIKWSQNSCRYDAFITLFTLGLFNKFQETFNPKLVKGRSINATDYKKVVTTR